MIKVLMYFFLLMLLGGVNTEKHKDAVCVNDRPVEIVPFKDYSYIEVNDKVPYIVSAIGEFLSRGIRTPTIH